MHSDDIMPLSDDEEMQKIVDLNMPVVTSDALKAYFAYMNRIVDQITEACSCNKSLPCSWLNIKELVGYFGAGSNGRMVTVIQRMIGDGLVRYIGEPGHYRYNVPDVEAALVDATQKGKSYVLSGPRKQMSAPKETTGAQDLDEVMIPYMDQYVASPAALVACGVYHLRTLRQSFDEIRNNSGRKVWMNQQELAKHFGYHKVTMCRKLPALISKGKIAYIGEGNRRRYKVADVEAALCKEAMHQQIKRFKKTA